VSKIGKTNLNASNQGLGCMAMSEFYGDPMPEEQAIALIKKAFSNGVNFFDTADIYGYGDNEVLLGRAVASLVNSGVARENIIIASKCGIIRDKNDLTKRGTDNSYQYVKESCKKSLARLSSSVGYIDLYYLHRIAENGAQIEEAMRAMAELLAENKIKAVGLSEANPIIIANANKVLIHYTQGIHQLAAVQSEYSLMTRNVENNGVLAICRKLGITFVAYSPLSRALLTGKLESAEQLAKNDFRRSVPRFQGENFEKNKAIVKEIRKLAEKKGCSIAQIALAWVMHQPGVIPIPGTTKEANLLSNIAADEVKLSSEEILFLNKLNPAQGTRYSEAAMKIYGFEGEL